MTDSATAKNKKTVKTKENKIFKKVLRQLLIYLISLAIVIGTFAGIVSIIYSKFLKPVDLDDKAPIQVEVPMGTSVNGIADILFKNKLIRNVGAFKLMVDFSNKTNKMQAGKYELSKNMTMQEMIDELLTGKVSVTSVKITMREGDDIRKMASRLVYEFKMDFTEEEFIKTAKDIDQFKPDFPFLQDIPEERQKGDFPLEGYLFPNTYYVFADDTPAKIISKMLLEFFKIYSEELNDKAVALGLTQDKVITLASVIQNEGKNPDFEKISAVFHNRLKIGMKLESDATIYYVLPKDVKQTNLTIEDTKLDSPYNTYLYPGLPIGPISSPGKAAINAALNPLAEYMKKDKPMLYFVLMDPEVGLHAFNSNYQDHIKDKEKYEKLWK